MQASRLSCNLQNCNYFGTCPSACELQPSPPRHCRSAALIPVKTPANIPPLHTHTNPAHRTQKQQRAARSPCEWLPSTVLGSLAPSWLSPLSSASVVPSKSADARSSGACGCCAHPCCASHPYPAPLRREDNNGSVCAPLCAARGTGVVYRRARGVGSGDMPPPLLSACSGAPDRCMGSAPLWLASG